jgi:hypothetical protein
VHAHQPDPRILRADRRGGRAAALPVAARDLQRIGIATSRWLQRIEELLEENCR